VIQHKLTKNTL